MQLALEEVDARLVELQRVGVARLVVGGIGAGVGVPGGRVGWEWENADKRTSR